METQGINNTEKCININKLLQSQIQLKGAMATSPFDTERDKFGTNIEKYRKEFNDNNCTQVLEQYRQAELGKVIGKFTGLDKARIESESVYERNQRIFFGGLVLIGGLIIITMFNKKK